jgi:DDE family transposase
VAAGRAAHGPGKIITDLAVAVALGGDCLADVAVLRAQPELFGPVASDPVVSRLVTRLAADAPRALKAIRAARARCEDRIRAAKDTGRRNLPLHGYAQNQIWCEIVTLACERLAWMQLLALTGPARRWEPKRLRLRLFTVAGRIVRGGRRLRLRLNRTGIILHPPNVLAAGRRVPRSQWFWI